MSLMLIFVGSPCSLRITILGAIWVFWLHGSSSAFSMVQPRCALRYGRLGSLGEPRGALAGSFWREKTWLMKIHEIHERVQGSQHVELLIAGNGMEMAVSTVVDYTCFNICQPMCSQLGSSKIHGCAMHLVPWFLPWATAPSQGETWWNMVKRSTKFKGSKFQEHDSQFFLSRLHLHPAHILTANWHSHVS